MLDVNCGGKKLTWDEAVSPSHYFKWKVMFKEMFELESIKFTRCLKPCNAVGNPDLIVFADGSTKAYGAVAYAMWELSDGSYNCVLLASRSKLASLKQITVPRLEVCGAILAYRLRNFIENEIKWTFDSVTHVIDSEIVRAQIQKDSFRFNTYVANRVSEIQSKGSSNEWYWVTSSLNAADRCTRGCKPSLLDHGSSWQTGPEFLCTPREQWPINQGCSVKLPDVLYVKQTESFYVNAGYDCVVDITRFSKYDKLINVTARILRAASSRSILSLRQEPETKDNILKNFKYANDVINSF